MRHTSTTQIFAGEYDYEYIVCVPKKTIFSVKILAQIINDTRFDLILTDILRATL